MKQNEWNEGKLGIQTYDKEIVTENTRNFNTYCYETHMLPDTVVPLMNCEPTAIIY